LVREHAGCFEPDVLYPNDVVNSTQAKEEKTVKRSTFLIVALVTILAVLAACGPTPTPEVVEKVVKETVVVEKEVEVTKEVVVKETVVVEKEVEPVTIKFFSHRFTEVPYGDILRKQVLEYETLHPNIKIQPVEAPTAERQAKLTTMVLGGEPPDAVFCARDMGGYIAQGVLMDLEPLIAKEPPGFKDNFPPNAAAAASDPETGHWMALPTETQFWTLVINDDRAAEVGLEIPADGVWTWEEFKAAADLLNDPDNDLYAFTDYGYGSDAHVITVGHWMLANGGSYWGFNKDCTEVSLVTPENIEAIEHYVSLAFDGYQPPGYIERGGGDHYRILGSIAAMAVTHPGGVSNAIANSGDTISGFTPVFLPGPGQKVALFNEAWAIAEGAEHVEEAWELIKWLNEDEQCIARMEVQGSLPASLSALEKAKETFPDMAFWIDLTDHSDYACYEYLPRGGEFKQLANDALTEIYQGADVTATLTQLETQIEDLLEE
jgi:ABC-type glycerol-3-phosphate transport system substrate-binding protein